jgi:hypothetical protein
MLGVFFTTPIAALLTVIGAASIPIIIHLLNRKRFRVVPWAAMRFLLSAQKRTVKRLRIEQWVLLALRTLLILLLLAAMVSVLPWIEPVWAKLFPSGMTAAATRSSRTHRILVIDGSFSMGLRHDDGTSFDRAKSLAEQVITASSPGDGFSLLVLSAPTQTIVPGPSDDSSKVTREIRELRLPHGNSDLAGGIASLDKMLSQPLGKYHDREVIVLTDRQRAFFPLAKDRPDGKRDESAAGIESWYRLQTRARVIVVDVGRDNVDNLAVTHLSLADPLALTRTPNAITAMVQNFGSADRTQVRVELHAGKAKSDPDDPPLAMRIAQQELVTIPAGATVPVTFPYQFRTAGEYVLQVRLEPDSLELDDARSIVVTVRDTVPILLVNGRPAAENEDQATYHLNVALNPFPGATRSPLTPFRPKILSEAQFADPSLGDLAACDCVFLCDVARLTESEAGRLDSHLKRGGGVIFCLGPQTDLEAYNRVLHRNGAGILPFRLVSRVRAPDDQFFNFAADDETFQRPPLSAFSSDSDRAALLGARVRQHVRVEIPARSSVRRILSFLPPAGRTITGGRGGSEPAILEWQRQRGRVMLVTTTVNTDWGTWPGSTAFLPLMHELARHAILGTPPRFANAGEPIVEYFPVTLGGTEATIGTPDGRTLTVAIEPQDEVRVLRFPDTDQSGIYRATIGAGRREMVYAVNVPAVASSAIASESDLRRADPAELQNPAPEADFQIVTALSQIQRRARDNTAAEVSDGPRSSAGPAIARYLLLTFFAVLLIELVLAWQFGSARTVAAEQFSRERSVRPLERWLLGPLTLLPVTVAAILGAVLIHAAITDEFLGFLPGGMRHAFERALDVPEAAPGEGTRWRLDYLAYLTGDTITDRWLIAVLGLATVSLVVVVYRKERSAVRARVPGDSSRPRSVIPTAAARIAMFLLVLTVLLPQLRLFFEREGWPDVAVIFDTSRSCGANDDYQDTDVKLRADQLAEAWQKLIEEKVVATRQRIDRLNSDIASAPPDRQNALTQERIDLEELLKELTSANRLNIAKALATGTDDWLGNLVRRRQVKVHVYHCSNQATRVAEITDGTQATEARDRIRDLRAHGESSQLGGVIRSVLSEFRGGSLGAIIFVTDGVTTEGEPLGQAARAAVRADVPLFFVGLGDSHEPRDLVLHDLAAEDSVMVRDRLVFEARVTAKGNLKATQVPVTLWEKKGNQLTKLKEEPARLEPGKPVKVKLVHQPTEAGDKVFVITVPEQLDETDKTNNRVEKTIFVADAKPVRILYIEGHPRYEFRFIKTLLEREAANPKGNKRLNLRVLQLDADRDHPTQDKSAISEFPGREELNAYDVVILGDADPRHPKLGEKNLQLLRDFVRERGGGLLFMAGEQHNPQSYRDTPLADVLPIIVMNEEPGERAAIEAGLANGFRPRLTPVGSQHPIFRFAHDDADNATIWNKLHPVFWSAVGYRANPAAEVLATHPRLPARRGSGTSNTEEFHPLAVQQFVGAGRVMFFGFDETWRWRFREDEFRFNQFWIQTVQYLSRHRIGRVELRLDKQTAYRRNEPIRVTVRFPDDAPAPPADALVKVIAERTRLRRPGDTTGDAPEIQSLILSKIEGSRATYEALMVRTPEGEYRFWLASPSVTGPRPQTEGRVLPPPGELDRLRMNQAEMVEAAKDSRGRFFSLADADQLIDALPAGTRVALNQPRPPWPIWNHALMFALIIGTLTTEWALRKRRRLL